MIETAFQYHVQTSYRRDQMSGHYLDWANQPTVFKDYHGLQPQILPRDFNLPQTYLYDLIGSESRHGETGGSVHMATLSQILYLTYSLTAQARHSGGDFYFRSAASAGALYPTEIYLTSCNVEGIEDGLYHFAIHRHCLVPLREKIEAQWIQDLAPMKADHPPVITFFLSAIFFRSAWKYRDRAYRYHLLDTGHVAENLSLALKSQNLPFYLSYDFDDERVNHLLGFDETKEAALALIHVPDQKRSVERTEAGAIEALPERIKRASKVSGKEVAYPPIFEMHRAASFVRPDRERGHRLQALGKNPESWEALDPLSTWSETMSYPETVFNRRSGRNFIKEPLAKNAMCALLDSLCAEDETDQADFQTFHDALSTGFITGEVEGFEPGHYRLNTSERTYGMVEAGYFNPVMAHICLNQGWLANAAVHFLFLTNLKRLDKDFGARGYRYAMMHAGRLGERLYLLATALGLGCCGIGAFYDEEAMDLLQLNKDSRLLYLVALGPTKSKKSK